MDGDGFRGRVLMGLFMNGFKRPKRVSDYYIPPFWGDFCIGERIAIKLRAGSRRFIIGRKCAMLYIETDC